MYSNRFIVFAIAASVGAVLLGLTVAGVALQPAAVGSVCVGALVMLYLVFNNNALSNQAVSQWQLNVPVQRKLGVDDDDVDKIRHLLIEPDIDPSYGMVVADDEDDMVEDDVVENRIVAVTRHHGIYILFSVGETVAAFIGLACVIFVLYEQLSRSHHHATELLWFAGASLGCAVLTLVYGYILWHARYWVLTNLRIIRTNVYPAFLAFLPDSDRALEYGKITGVNSNASTLGKQLGYGTMFIDTPANNSVNNSDNSKREENLDWSKVSAMGYHHEFTTLLRKAMARARANRL